MKKKTLTLILIICAVLAVILVSVMALVAANNTPASEGDDVSVQSQQETTSDLDPAQLLDSTHPNCILVLNGWEAKNNVLTVDAFAMAFLPGAAQFEARLDFWKNNEVLTSKPLVLTPGEGADSYEAEVVADFAIPELGANDQLQVWLIVELGDADVVYSCAASWYLEDGQLMLITG